MKKGKILILCTGNSCRSQMAHGFLKTFAPDWQIESAGTQASGTINPIAVEVMREKGIDISGHSSDPVEKYLNEPWDFVITVCGGAAENCPHFPGSVKNRIHMGFEDPSEVQGKPDFILSEFRRVRDEIEAGFLKFYETQMKK